MSWILFTLVFGICKGAREGVKKKALEKSTLFEVLFVYTLIGFILILPASKDVFGVSPEYYFYIFIKSLLVFTAWLCSFNSIKHMPVGMYGVMDMARVLFATVMGITIMGENATLKQMAGLLMVLLGLVLVNIQKKSSKDYVAKKYVLLTLVSCLLTATSGVMDKWLTKTVTSSQLQFWYMFFMCVMYGVCILFSKTKLSIRSISKNYWIPVLSILFVIGDRALFIANENPESRITIMTLIKQSSVLAAIVAGRLMFGERGTLKRTLCALLIVLGILVATV